MRVGTGFVARSDARCGACDLGFGRESTAGLLRIAEPPVHRDLENAAAALAQADRGRRMLFQDLIPCGTRTRLIASHAAVFDLDLHGHIAF
jgi:hypothetical protein